MLRRERGFLLKRLFVDTSWGFTEIPYEPEPREHFEGVVRDVDLPPVEALALRARVSVVVVMPSLAKGDDREEEAVLAVVARLEASLSEHVSEGVNAEGAVVEERCADAESPREHLERAGPKLRVVRLKEVAESCNSETEKNWWYDVVSLEEAELWELHEILHKLPTGLNELCA